MAKTKVIAVANQKDGIGKSTSVFTLGASLVANSKKLLFVDVDPQGDPTKMLGLRKPNDLPLTLTMLCAISCQASAANNQKSCYTMSDSTLFPAIAVFLRWRPAQRTTAYSSMRQKAVLWKFTVLW